MQKKVNKKERGFILVLTMLIVSVTLAISFGTYSVSIKEVVLGSYMRDSERAFFAADRARECALFWDRSVSPGPNGLPYTIFATSTLYVFQNMTNVTCNTGTTNVRLDGGTGGNPTAWTVPNGTLTTTSGITT